jgi:hypothetical protein
MMKKWETEILKGFSSINQFFNENNGRQKKNLTTVHNLTITDLIFFNPLFPVL